MVDQPSHNIDVIKHVVDLVERQKKPASIISAAKQAEMRFAEIFQQASEDQRFTLARVFEAAIGVFTQRIEQNVAQPAAIEARAAAAVSMQQALSKVTGEKMSSTLRQVFADKTSALLGRADEGRLKTHIESAAAQLAIASGYVTAKDAQTAIRQFAALRPPAPRRKK